MIPRRFLFLVTFLALFSWMLCAESVSVVNRTGRVLDLIQAAPAGQNYWGDDLIPDQVLEDGDAVSLDLIGEAPWSCGFLDSDGEVYVLYDVNLARTGKLSVGPEHLARLSMFAGARRNISISNRTGSTLSSLRISAVAEGVWGDDVLSGRYIRNGETNTVGISALPGALSFDIRFTLISDGKEVSYEKKSVILTDGASLVLTSN